MRSWFALCFLLAALLALAAPVQADFPAEHVLQYRAFVHTEQNADGIIAPTNVDVPDVHSWSGGNGTSILEVRVSLVVNSGVSINPVADYQLLWDGSAVADCTWRVEGGTITGGRFNPLISMYCKLATFVLPGAHTIEVQRTAVTGAPVSNAVTSIILHQTETVSTMTDFEALTGLTGTEFGTIIGLAVALIAVAAFSKSPALNVFAGTLAVLLGVLLLFFTSSAVVVVLAVFLGLAGSAQLLITFLQALPGKKPRQFFE